MSHVSVLPHPRSDGVVTIRPATTDDVPVLVAGRDEVSRRFQNRSANALAFACASGPEMMSVPLAFQPSKYEALTLRLDGAGRPLTPHTRTRSRPACSRRMVPKSATTSGVMYPRGSPIS